MADLYAISQGIAARFAAGLVTPPATYQNIRVATANPPNAMPALPCVIVFPDSGTRDLSRNTTRLFSHRFMVRFYYAQAGDLARDAVALQKWATVLIDQMKGAVQLAGTVVGLTRVSVDDYRIGYFTYGGKDYSGVEMTVGAETSEAWAAVA